MKASCYNYFFNGEEPDCALWNTKTGAFFRISRHEYDCLRGSSFESLDEQRRMQFADTGVLVPNGMDEIGDIVNMLPDARESSPLYFRILTTTDCNASCAYCYEKGIAASAMDADRAQRTADFIIRRYREREADNMARQRPAGLRNRCSSAYRRAAAVCNTFSSINMILFRQAAARCLPPFQMFLLAGGRGL